MQLLLEAQLLKRLICKLAETAFAEKEKAKIAKVCNQPDTLDTSVFYSESLFLMV
jgi:hypothetical protein